LVRDPRANEIVHTERVDVSEVERCEGLGSFGAVALGDIAEDPNFF
jgi:hypothetical protein